MGTARKRWSPDEKKKVVKMAADGYTYKQIAEKLRPGVPTAWRSVGEILREARKAQEKKSAPTPTSHAPGVTSTPIPSSSLKYNSTVELPEGMENSLTAQAFMAIMDDEQRALFIATYEDLRGDADDESVTAAENDMMIRASHCQVKYLNAQKLLHLAESYLMMELEGYLTDTDSDNAKRKFAGGREAYKKEVEQWQKEYMDYMDGLKLTRKQRLDKIKDTRNTFLDLQQELMDRARQGSIVEEIKKINRATVDELQRMAKGEEGPDGQKHSWLVGAFDEFLAPAEPTEQLENKEDTKDGSE